MTRTFSLSMGMVLVLVVPGCVSARAQRVHADMRERLLRLYEDQVMDNLIRVHNRRPIVQLAYSNVTGQIKGTTTTELSGSQTDTAGAITNLFAYKGSLVAENLLTVTANPIIDGGTQAKNYETGVNFEGAAKEVYSYRDVPSIYDYYIDFVWRRKAPPVPKNDGPHLQFFLPRAEQGQVEDESKENELLTGKLVMSCHEPSDSIAHVKRKQRCPCGERECWYFVPVEYASDYFELAMRVTFGLSARLGERTDDSVLNELRLQRLKN